MDSKYWLDSTTIRGALVTVIPVLTLVLKAFGIDFATGEQAHIVDGIVAIAGAIGTALAIYGRFNARQTITTNPNP